MGIIEANILVFIAYNASFLISLFNYKTSNVVKKIILMLSYSVINCYSAVAALLIEVVDDLIESKIVRTILVILLLCLGVLMYKNIFSLLPFIAVILSILTFKNRILSKLLLIASNIIWMTYDYNNMLYLKFIILIYVVGYELIGLAMIGKGKYERITKFKSSNKKKRTKA